jgi:hypothetical protein
MPHLDRDHSRGTEGLLDIAHPRSTSEIESISGASFVRAQRTRCSCASFGVCPTAIVTTWHGVTATAFTSTVAAKPVARIQEVDGRPGHDGGRAGCLSRDG